MCGERGRRQRAHRLGDLGPHGIQQFLDRAAAFGERDDQTVFAVDAVGEVVLELRLRLPHRRTVPGTQHVEVLAHLQARERQQVAGHRAAVGTDEHAAVTQHRVAREARARSHEREVVGGVPRRGDGLERAEARALAEQHIHRPASRRQRRGMALQQPTRRFAVVVMIVRQHHAAEPAAAVDRGAQPGQMLLLQRPRIDYPRGLAPDHPGVRPRQRQRPGVRRAHEQDVVVRQQVGFGTGLC